MSPRADIPRGVSRPGDRTARQAWLESQRPAYVPHPEPQVRARAAQPEEIPLAATRLIKLAGIHGWLVNTLYARGTSLTAKGTPGKVVECITVAMMRAVDRRHIVACWEDGRFDLAYVGQSGEPAVRVGARALKGVIETPVEQEAAA